MIAEGHRCSLKLYTLKKLCPHISSSGYKKYTEPLWGTGNTLRGSYSWAAVAIHSWLWLIEVWGYSKGRVYLDSASVMEGSSLLIVGSEGRPTNFACSVLFCEFNDLWTKNALFQKHFTSSGTLAPLKCLLGQRARSKSIWQTVCFKMRTLNRAARLLESGRCSKVWALEFCKSWRYNYVNLGARTCKSGR